MGLVTEVGAEGREVERALELAEAIAAFPADTLLSDRDGGPRGALACPSMRGWSSRPGSAARTAARRARRGASGFAARG